MRSIAEASSVTRSPAVMAVTQGLAQGGEAGRAGGCRRARRRPRSRVASMRPSGSALHSWCRARALRGSRPPDHRTDSPMRPIQIRGAQTGTRRVVHQDRILGRGQVLEQIERRGHGMAALAPPCTRWTTRVTRDREPGPVGVLGVECNHSRPRCRASPSRTSRVCSMTVQPARSRYSLGVGAPMRPPDPRGRYHRPQPLRGAHGLVGGYDRSPGGRSRRP